MVQPWETSVHLFRLATGSIAKSSQVPFYLIQSCPADVSHHCVRVRVDVNDQWLTERYPDRLGGGVSLEMVYPVQDTQCCEEESGAQPAGFVVNKA